MQDAVAVGAANDEITLSCRHKSGGLTERHDVMALDEPVSPSAIGVADPIRFAFERRGVEGKVGPFEGRWWTLDWSTGADETFAGERSAWRI